MLHRTSVKTLMASKLMHKPSSTRNAAYCVCFIVLFHSQCPFGAINYSLMRTLENLSQKSLPEGTVSRLSIFHYQEQVKIKPSTQARKRTASMHTYEENSMRLNNRQVHTILPDILYRQPFNNNYNDPQLHLPSPL